MTCPHCNAPNADDARFCGVCGRATSPTESASNPSLGEAPAMIGREIAGRYRIHSKLGEGGMGAVYRAEQISLKRTVAVKLLRPEVASSQLLLRRFNAEAEAVAKLSHPNTVNIYDFGQDTDGTLFIAMEFIEGRSLRSVIHAEAPLALRRALAIAVQVAASLTDAHGHAIIHRDLKPDNVMLQERGRQRDVVRVLDFGIAKLRDEGRATQMQMTQAGDMLGTPQYMAPEQIRAEAIDGRTDVYALGCMVYEMLTARLPFEAPTVLALLSKHLIEAVVPPSQRRPDLVIPPSVEHLILVAMAKDPRARPASMEVFGEQLAALLAELPADTAQHPATGPLSKQVQVAPSFAPQTPAPSYTPPQVAGYPPQVASYTPPQVASYTPPQVTSFAPPAPSAPAFPPPPGAILPAPTPVPGPREPSGGGKGLLIVLALLVLGGGGFAVYWFALRAPRATATDAAITDPGADDPGTDDVTPPPPEPPVTPKDPTNDPWGASTHGDRDPTDPSPSAQRVGVLPDGARLIPPDGFVLVPSPANTQVIMDKGRSLMVALGPLISASHDPTEMANEWATQNNLHFEGLSQISSHGEQRFVAAFSGTAAAGAFTQLIVGYEMPSYRVGVLIQASPQLVSQPAFQRTLAALLESNLILP